ncbi:MAG TPA: histone deacetylase, partial [Candidatus Aenigmarchaeota archaeon]|nr:histone deacetylase [Candidatus Aenigmarchaeota archaeon]
MKIIFSEKCLEFSEVGHPESPERVRNAYEFLKGKYEFVSPRPAREEEILKVHSKELLESVKNNTFFDWDSPNYPNIYEYALLSAGAAIRALETRSFSLMRPPGHHAGRNFLGGFCYFNNIAVAIKNANSRKNVLIVDIDGHHGNGTEDIFRGSENVVYLSLHRSPYYPGTGLKSYENVVNKPLPQDVGEKVYT